jgi:hypothetical protein
MVGGKMRKQNYIQPIFVVIVVIFLILGCKNLSVGSASLTDVVISSDRDGKMETRNFKPGETVYANARISGDTSKSKVLFYIEDEQNRSLNGSKVTVNLEGADKALYYLKVPPDFSKGKLFVIAELDQDENSSKTTAVTQLRKAIEIR